MKRCSLFIIVAIALAACAGAAAPSITPPEPSRVAPTAASGHVAVFPNTIIVYRRDGGFAGKSEKWTIYPTGRIVAGDGTEWQVPPEQVAPLFKLAEVPGFEGLNARYAPAGACNDCYTHTLTILGQGEPKTVTFVDGADLPASLQQMMSEVNKSITR